MRGFMFRNKWAALLFVASTLAGVTTLVGTERNGGTIQDATAELAAQKSAVDALNDTGAPANPVETLVEIPSDEDLIDPATGYDPTPIDDFTPAGEETEQADVYLVTPAEPAPSEAMPPAQQAE